MNLMEIVEIYQMNRFEIVGLGMIYINNIIGREYGKENPRAN